MVLKLHLIKPGDRHQQKGSSEIQIKPICFSLAAVKSDEPLFFAVYSDDPAFGQDFHDDVWFSQKSEGIVFEVSSI